MLARYGTQRPRSARTYDRIMTDYHNPSTLRNHRHHRGRITQRLQAEVTPLWAAVEFTAAVV
jgi:hypothetical protein